MSRLGVPMNLGYAANPQADALYQQAAIAHQGANAARQQFPQIVQATFGQAIRDRQAAHEQAIAMRMRAQQEQAALAAQYAQMVGRAMMEQSRLGAEQKNAEAERAFRAREGEADRANRLEVARTRDTDHSATFNQQLAKWANEAATTGTVPEGLANLEKAAGQSGLLRALIPGYSEKEQKSNTTPAAQALGGAFGRIANDKLPWAGKGGAAETIEFAGMNAPDSTLSETDLSELGTLATQHGFAIPDVIAAFKRGQARAASAPPAFGPNGPTSMSAPSQAAPQRMSAADLLYNQNNRPGVSPAWRDLSATAGRVSDAVTGAADWMGGRWDAMRNYFSPAAAPTQQQFTPPLPPPQLAPQYPASQPMFVPGNDPRFWIE